jgi:hypothetical protein
MTTGTECGQWIWIVDGGRWCWGEAGQRRVWWYRKRVNKQAARKDEEDENKGEEVERSRRCQGSGRGCTH